MPNYLPTQDGQFYPPDPPWNFVQGWVEDEAALTTYGMVGPAAKIYDVDAGVSYISGTLTVNTQGFRTASAHGILHLYAQNEAVPALWSASNLPSVSGDVVEIGTAPIDFTIFGEIPFVLDMAALQNVLDLPGWNGRIALLFAVEAITPPPADIFFLYLSNESGGGPLLSLVTAGSSLVISPPRSSEPRIPMNGPPVTVVRRGGAWRLMEPDGRLLPKRYSTREAAARAARARNAHTEA